MDASRRDALAANTGLTPVAPQTRIQTLDLLRGWAVFGILLADVDATFNIVSGTDQFLRELHLFFIVNKFWPLFSFLSAWDSPSN